jgi:hypothetical protein
MSRTSARRSYGTGSLYVRTDAAGRESWYGQWRIDGRLVKRRVGAKRQAGERDGLTKPQAERELRRLIDEGVWSSPRRGDAVTVTVTSFGTWATTAASMPSRGSTS